MITLLDRDQLAKTRGRVLDRRDQPAARVAAIDDLPRCTFNTPGDRFRIRAGHDLRHFVEARRNTRRTRGVRQPFDLGDRARQCLQSDNNAHLAIGYMTRRARRMRNCFRPEQRR